MRQSQLPPHKRYPFLAALVLMLIMAVMMFTNPLGTAAHAVTDAYHWVIDLRVVKQMRYDFSHSQKGSQ